MAGNNALSIISPYIQSGNPDTLNQIGPAQLTGGGNAPGDYFPYAPGDLGEPFELGDKKYMIVFNDSGATSATPTGAVAANMLAFWKDKANRIVTNDRRFSLGATVANGSGNFVAGVYRVAASPGALICLLTKGYAIPVKAGTVSGAGQLITADVDTNGPEAVGVAVGTAPGYMTLGAARAAAGGGNVSADIDIPTL